MWFYNVILFLTRMLFRLLYKVEVHGQENLLKGGAIIAPNHVSFLDPPLIAISNHEPVHSLGKQALFNNALFGWFISKLCCHPISKGTDNISTIKTIHALLKQGGKILLFPEGTRQNSYDLGNGQIGIGSIILKSKAAVIPTFIHGTLEAWGKNKKRPSFRKQLTCVFGAPIFPAIDKTPGKESRQIIVNEIMTKISLLQEWLANGKKGQIP